MVLGERERPRDVAAGRRPDRRSQRRERTKEEIVRAAWRLARKVGLTQFSLRELAQAVDMQAPSLYEYFPSKMAIYDAMFGQGAREGLAAVGAPITAADTREALRETARRLFDFATEDPVRTQLLFQRTIPGFEPSAESYAPAVEMRARVEALLAEHGVTDPDDLDLWTALLGGLVNQQLANDPGGTRWARLLDRTVDMFVAGVARQPASKSQRGGQTGKKTNRDREKVGAGHGHTG